MGGNRVRAFLITSIGWTVLIMPITHTHTTHPPLPPSGCEGDILQIRDLHFSYPDGHAALHGVSLKLCSGDKVALLGPNGAGKSTLMLHLNGILGGHGEPSNTLRVD